MSKEFDGLSAAITGAGSGIGLATAKLLSDRGAKVYGPVEQGAFLKTLGIEARARALANKATPSQQDDIQKALHRLTDSSEMGRLFKVMGFSHALPIPPAGF